VSRYTTLASAPSSNLVSFATVLRTADDALRDVAGADLVDAATGLPTGLRLVRWIGAGGMASVFLAERDPAVEAPMIAHFAPRQLAVKLNKLSTERELVRMNLDPLALMKKELAALGRVMQRKPPTEFVVGYYGHGTADIEHAGRVAQRLPWIALEYIEGGREGPTLHDRVRRSGGLDPVRCLRLTRGILSGARVLHDSGVIHRDLKPENVFVTGPLDDETPKIGDCGIARVEGLSMGTIAALTPAYGGPEQLLSAHNPTQKNPLIGPWTDVHAVAAIVWFMIAGESWCQSDTDRAWREGERRSLRTAARLHEGFMRQPEVLGVLDEILARGAAHRLPASVWASPAATSYRAFAEVRLKGSMGRGHERYPDLDSFGAALLPRLDQAARQAIAAAIAEQRVATTVRPTLAIEDTTDATNDLAEIREQPPRNLVAALREPVAPARPNEAVFLQDGKALVRFGARLVYFVGERAHPVAVPEEHAAAVAATRWLGRGPTGGFALAGEDHLLLIKNGAFERARLPRRESGGEVGTIQALLADGRTFGVITAEVDDSEGGADLWLSAEGETWSAPITLPLGGEVHAASAGPYGTLVVGSRQRKRGRALHLGLDGRAVVFTGGVNDKPPLTLALCSAMRDSWAAADGVVLCFGPSQVQVEHQGDEGAVASLALDIVGVPWLVTERRVLRRHVTGGEATWKRYYEKHPDRPPLVAIGFSPEGAHVLDAAGNATLIVPRAWHPTEPS
jgi:hypothetical protein